VNHNEQNDIEMEDAEEGKVPEWIIAFSLGFSQAQIERVAASHGVPARFIATRLGALLQAQTGGPSMGTGNSLPQLPRHSTARGHVRKPALALVGESPGTVRRSAKNQHGRLKKSDREPGDVRNIVFADLSRRAEPVEYKTLLHELNSKHPEISTPAFHACIQGMARAKTVKKLSGKRVMLRIGAKANSQRKSQNVIKPSGIKDLPLTILRGTALTANQILDEIERKTHRKVSNRTGIYDAMHKLVAAGAVKAVKKDNVTVYSLTGKKPPASVRKPALIAKRSTSRSKPGESIAAVVSILEKAPSPLALRRDVIKAVRAEHPRFTVKAVHQALSRALAKGHIVHSTQGYTLATPKTNGLADTA
jgi:Fe2+ or Zn2+ uptake regulation protein